MPSPATVDSLEAALERAVSRFDDGSATGAQMRHHMACEADEPHARRLRARLTLAAAQAEGGSEADAVDPACAVEIVYAFSLIHEDIEDGRAQRAGQPTVWSSFGLAHGINAGDALCAVAYLALLDGLTSRSPGATVAMTRVLHEAHLAMCGGHGRAIADDREPSLTLEGFRAMMNGKTAALVGAACELGALAAGADADRARGYARLGAAYGRALHIAADVRDTWSATAPPRPGSWTYPAVWALNTAPSAARDRVAEAFAQTPFADAGWRRSLVEALDALGARAAAQHAIDAETAAADAAATALGIDADGRVRALLRQALAHGPS
jgi:geranylgeranyl diphosphate synthase type I